MSALTRQVLSLTAWLALVALLFGSAISTGFELWDMHVDVAELKDEIEAMQARAGRLAPHDNADPGQPLLLIAPTITLAGAILQQRVESAVTAARGRLASSQVELGTRAAQDRVILRTELTIGQEDLQRLLFDLETGRPALVVELFEGQAAEKPEPGAEMRVSLTLSGQWSAKK